MDCAEMLPIVNGLKKQYADCLTVDEVNFHADSPLRRDLNPFGSPEFILLDSTHAILYRWFGVTAPEEFAEVLDPLCAG